MYNEYIYEKKLNEEKSKEIKNEKMIKYRKIHLKKREELSKQYYEKIQRFMINIINELELKSNKPNYFNRPKIIEDNKTSTIPKVKKIINKRIFSYNSASKNKHKYSKISISPLKSIEVTSPNLFELPKMRFSAINDFERIKDIYARNGKVIDNKILKKLNKKFRKTINEHDYDFLRTNQNNTNSINNIYPSNITENPLLKNIDDSSKKVVNENHYKIFKNKILNSKLIKNITLNEKYKCKTFYQGLTFSLINKKNINTNTNKKFNQTKIKPILTPTQTHQNLLHLKNHKEKEESNTLNFYQDYMKKFIKFNDKLKQNNKNDKLFEESSDSSSNDNGQGEILKKIISLNHPVLSEPTEEKKTENKNILLYLKNLFKEEQKEEHQQKKFIQNDNEYNNDLIEKKFNKIDKKKKYIFLRGKRKYILVTKNKEL